MSTKESNSSKRDLAHFLALASAQVRHRIKTAQVSGLPETQLRALSLLNELISEQVPTDGIINGKNPSSSAR
jgi:hypothetical protein